LRVLILTQHFTPEITAAAARLHAFAAGLAGLGHEVEVIAEVPNHPQGVVEPGYRRRVSIKREMDGFAVRYVWVRARPAKTTANRLAFYASYAAMASAAGALTRRPDVVLASSPPLPAGAAAALVAKRHRVPWVLDVRDLWPEVAITLGELRGARAIGLARRLERRLYRSAAAVVTVNEAFRADIAARMQHPEKVSVIPNGTTQAWLDAAGLQVTRAEAGLSDDEFVWTYAGNVGLAQGLSAAVDAADILGEGYRLVILGTGPLLGRLRERAAALPPGRVEFREPVQPAQARRDADRPARRPRRTRRRRPLAPRRREPPRRPRPARPRLRLPVPPRAPDRAPRRTARIARLRDPFDFAIGSAADHFAQDRP
jgi:putative colanic acid biosynthesis glycosyltransferase WcaI